MATDLLSALADAAASDGSLSGAGAGTWHFATDPEPGYPYVVVSSLGSRIKHRNFGKGQVHEQHVRVNVFSGVEAEAAAIGGLARAFLESLQSSPVTFDEGRLIDSHQTGEDLVRARKAGPQGVPFVWLCSLTWAFSWSRDRA